MIENPADELRLRRIINTPARKIGDKSVETAMQLAEMCIRDSRSTAISAVFAYFL